MYCHATDVCLECVLVKSSAYMGNSLCYGSTDVCPAWVLLKAGAYMGNDWLDCAVTPLMFGLECVLAKSSVCLGNGWFYVL